MLSRPLVIKRKSHWQPTLPPATSAKMPKPQNIVDLAEKFAASYKAPRRIGMLKAAS
jgi:hypothetical protein